MGEDVLLPWLKAQYLFYSEAYRHMRGLMDGCTSDELGLILKSLYSYLAYDNMKIAESLRYLLTAKGVELGSECLLKEVGKALGLPMMACLSSYSKDVSTLASQLLEEPSRALEMIRDLEDLLDLAIASIHVVIKAFEEEPPSLWRGAAIVLLEGVKASLEARKAMLAKVRELAYRYMRFKGSPPSLTG